MKDPSFLFYYKDFLMDTSGFSAEVIGWYVRLLCHQAEQYSLPEDVSDLALLAQVPYDDYPKFQQSWKRTLVAKFGADEESGRIYNRKLRGVMEKRAAYSNKQKLRGLRGSYSKKIAKEYPQVKDSKSVLDNLIDDNFLKLNENERSVRFKHTLEAIIVNADVNVIVNKAVKKKEGSGEKDSDQSLRLRWNNIDSPLEALKSNDFRFAQLFTNNQQFKQLNHGVEFWLEQWALSIDSDSKDWKDNSWQRLGQLATKYLLSCWANEKNRKKKDGGSRQDRPLNLEP